MTSDADDCRGDALRDEQRDRDEAEKDGAGRRREARARDANGTLYTMEYLLGARRIFMWPRSGEERELQDREVPAIVLAELRHQWSRK